MTSLLHRLSRPFIAFAEPPKNPWGPAGNGGKNEDGGEDGGAGPRNPWTIPPAGKRGAPGPSALDQLLRRARGAGGGGNGGRPGIPGVPAPKSLWAIGLAILIGLWLLWSCVHPIGPQQRGVVTLFGSYYGTLDPGVRLTLPAPIASVTKIDVQNIRIEKFPDSGDAENLMLTRDQNIVNLSFSVRWNIANPEDYVFQIKDPTSTVRATAESVMREVVANMTLDDAIGSGRGQIESQVQDRMQRILDAYKSGVHVQGVTLNGAVPPQSVKESFNDVIAAQQDAVAAKNKARGYAQQIIANAQGDAAQFDKVYAQYKLAPEVTRKRIYYETMEGVLAKTDKVVVETPGVAPFLPLPGMNRGQGQSQPGSGR